jgi:hypothetical protein
MSARFNTVPTKLKPRNRSPHPHAAPLTAQQRAEKDSARKERTALIDTFVQGFIADVHAKALLMAEELNYSEDYCYSLLFQEGIRWRHTHAATAFNAFISLKSHELKTSTRISFFWSE